MRATGHPRRRRAAFPGHVSLSAIIVAFISASTAGADESVKAATPEALWEISRNHLKDPFRWPSVWRNKPQAQAAAGMAGWTEGKTPIVEPSREASHSPVPSKPKPDWRASEEKRTLAYLAKVGPLNEALVKPLPTEMEPEPRVVNAQGAAINYMAGPLLLSTPAIAEPDENGRMYPGECRLRYSRSNESAILQPYDEVTLTVGSSAGVKAGDLFRAYEVGPRYRSFATGRPLGHIVETNGIVEVIRTGEKSSVGRLIKCYGTLSRDTRAAPLGTLQEIAATGYSPLPDARITGQVVWVTQQQQLPQPYSFAVVDQGTKKGFRVGDMVLFFNRVGGRMTEKVLGNGLVVSLQEESATILIQDIYPGIINRGDHAVAVQTTVL